MKLLHIYGQGAWHDSVRIVGNRDALIMLRDLLGRAVAEGGVQENPAVDAFFVADGEGFTVRVEIRDTPWEDWLSLAMPYSDSYARDAPLWEHPAGEPRE